jgi:predicted transcriptional regulator
MSTNQKPLSVEEATVPARTEPDADVRAWHDRKIKAGLADADAGRFASPEAVKAVVKKYIPNG